MGYCVGPGVRMRQNSRKHYPTSRSKTLVRSNNRPAMNYIRVFAVSLSMLPCKLLNSRPVRARQQLIHLTRI